MLSHNKILSFLQVSNTSIQHIKKRCAGEIDVELGMECVKPGYYIILPCQTFRRTPKKTLYSLCKKRSNIQSHIYINENEK